MYVSVCVFERGTFHAFGRFISCIIHCSKILIILPCCAFLTRIGKAFSVRGSGGLACVGEVLSVAPCRSPQGEAAPPASGHVPFLPGEHSLDRESNV